MIHLFRKQSIRTQASIFVALLMLSLATVFMVQRALAAVSVVNNNSAAPDTVFPGQNTPATLGEMYSVAANGNNDGDTANFDLDWKDGNVPNNVSFVWDSAQDVFGDHDWSEYFTENIKNIVTVNNYLRIKSSINTTPGTYQFRIKVTECDAAYHDRQCPAGSSSAYTTYMYFYVADYSVSVTPPSQTVGIGQTSGPYTVTITGNHNFADDAARTINLTLQNLPSDAIVRWSDGGTTASTTITVNLGQTSATKTFTLASSIAATTNFSVQGSFGYSDGNGQPQTMVRSAASELVVQNNQPPDFLLTLTPPSNTTIQAGQTSGQYVLAITPENGFSGTVTFTTSGLPADAVVSWQNGSNQATTNTWFTLQSSTIGSYNFTVQGTSGSVNHGAGASFAVTAPASSVTVNPTNLVVDNITGAVSDTAVVSVYPGDYTGTATVQLNWWDGNHSPSGKLIGLWGDGAASEPFSVNLIADTTTTVAMKMQLSDAITVNNYVYDVWVKKSDGSTLYGGRVGNVISVRQPDDSDRNIAITLIPDPNDLTHKKYNGTVKNNGTKSRSIKFAASANQPGIVITASPLVLDSLQPGVIGGTVVTVNWANTVTCGTYEVHLQEFGYADPDAMANIEVTDGCVPPPAADFAVTAVTPNPLTLDRTATGTYTVTVQRLNGFTGPITIDWTAVPTP